MYEFDFFPEHSHYLEELRIEKNKKTFQQIFIDISAFLFFFILGWCTSMYFKRG